MPKILIVEDDFTIIRTLEAYLLSEGFETVSVSGQRQALSALEKEIVDLLILDISLAEGNGFAVCEAAKGHGLPVIFLTASGDENSVVRGLDMGADDYIAKPFRPRELVSRIRSVLRRSGKTSSVVMLGSVSVDAEKGIVSKNGTEINLSALEFRLLMAFVNHRGKLLTRNALLEEIWDAGGDFVNDNTLTVYIKRLREKIEDDPQKPEIIRNPELKRELLIDLSITVVAALIGFLIRPICGMIALAVGLLLSGAHIAFAVQRYHQMEALAQRLDRILHGQDRVLIEDAAEGELSILNSELQKMTTRLQEQANQLSADKQQLTEAIQDIFHQIRTPLTSSQKKTCPMTGDFP